jgi:hypothetical protein
MRFVVVLLLLAADVSAPIYLKVESKVTIPSLNALISSAWQTCDQNGAVLFQPYTGNDFSVFRVRPSGQDITKYTYQGNYESQGWPYTYQDDNGGLAMITENENNSYFVFIDRQGQIKRSTKIQGLRAGSFAPFGHGLYLVVGTQRGQSDEKRGTLWIVDDSGRVLSPVLKDPSPKIMGDAQEPRDQKLDLFATSNVVSGGDGFVYVLRAFTTPLVLKISSAGTVVNTFRLQSSEGNADTIFASKGRFVVQYSVMTENKEERRVKHVRLDEFDASTGEQLRSYIVKLGEVGSTLACYEPGRFTITGADEKGKLTIAVATP